MPHSPATDTDGTPMMELVIFTDPLYGTERYLKFSPAWVAAAEDRTYRLFPWRRYPVTHITFHTGKRFFVAGHHAAQINAQRPDEAETAGNDGP
jgi:hypothetical protein